MPDKPKKLDLNSMNISAENRAKLKAGFTPTERIEILHLENGCLVRADVNTIANYVRAVHEPPLYGG